MGRQEPSALRPATPSSALESGELALSAERRALLAPKLRALLDDFGQLAALESPELEPAFGSVATVEGEADGNAR